MADNETMCPQADCRYVTNRPKRVHWHNPILGDQGFFNPPNPSAGVTKSSNSDVIITPEDRETMKVLMRVEGLMRISGEWTGNDWEYCKAEWRKEPPSPLFLAMCDVMHHEPAWPFEQKVIKIFNLFKEFRLKDVFYPIARPTCPICRSSCISVFVHSRQMDTLICKNCQDLEQEALMLMKLSLREV